MSLLSNPVTLSDGTTDHIFSFRSQQPDTKAVVGVYIEDAAALADESQIIVKHDDSGSAPRHLLQRTIKKVPAANAAGTRKRITVNFTVTADREFTLAEVLTEFNILVDALGETGVCASMLASKL